MVMRVLALYLAACSACVSRPHHRLEAPAPGASPQEKLDAYEKHRPAAEASLVAVSSGTVVASRTDFLVLGNGRRVYHAEDLAPLVAEDSATAESGRLSAEAATRAKAWNWTGWALVGGGLVLGSAAILDSGDPGSDDFGPNKTLLGIGTVAFLGGLGAMALASFRYAPVAHDERVSAFATYDKDLRARLDICVDGTRIIPCGAAPPAVAPAPVSPPPAPAPVAPAPAPAPQPAPAAVAPAPAPTAAPPATTP
jgi:hypothetical protein